MRFRVTVFRKEDRLLLVAEWKDPMTAGEHRNRVRVRVACPWLCSQSIGHGAGSLHHSPFSLPSGGVAGAPINDALEERVMASGEEKAAVGLIGLGR